jgi:excinuclease ABC subunit C
MSRKKYHSEVISRIQKEVPQKPGVYLFIDGFGKIMYIGKSVNMKKRMLSYFRPNLDGIENRIQEMIFNIRDFAFHEADTELLALLLEDMLIKKHLPGYNIRQREFTQYRYLLITTDRYPACKMIDHSEDFGQQTVYGPFKDQYFVEDILHVIQRFFHLRACQDPEPFRRSLNYELGYCKSPCRGKIAPREYSRIVERVIDFLNGNDTFIMDKMTKEMDTSVATLDFERASELKKRLEFCTKFCIRQRFIHQFKTQNLVIRDNGDPHSTCLFVRGQLVKPTHLIPEAATKGRNDDARFLLDRANIVYNWIAKEKNNCEYDFTSPEDSNCDQSELQNLKVN